MNIESRLRSLWRFGLVMKYRVILPYLDFVLMYAFIGIVMVAVVLLNYPMMCG